MSVSAERVALANQAVLRTFEQTCVAWRAVPHWDTRNPGQMKVRADVVHAFDGRHASLTLCDKFERFEVTLAQATAPTPDPLLGAVIAATIELADQVDADVLPRLVEPARTAGDQTWYRPVKLPKKPDDAEAMLDALLDGRDLLEAHSYRAGSCLLAAKEYHRALNRLVGGVVVADELLRAGAVGAAYRAKPLDSQDNPLMVMIGWRQDRSGGCAAHASPGEEPVDLAVSVPPSLEVVGDTAGGRIELVVRVRYALRPKDDRGVVVFHRPAPSPAS